MASVISIAIAPTVIVTIAMTIGIANSVNAIRQRCILAFGSSLRQVINNIRLNVNRLMDINEKLTKEIEEIENEVSR